MSNTFFNFLHKIFFVRPVIHNTFHKGPFRLTEQGRAAVLFVCIYPRPDDPIPLFTPFSLNIFAAMLYY